MADEVYARLIYTRPVAPSFLEQAGPDDPLIVLNSFSKPWAMTGWAGRLADAIPPTWASNLPSWCRSTRRACRISCRGGRDRGPRKKGDGFIAEMVERCRAGGEAWSSSALSAHPRITIAAGRRGVLCLLRLSTGVSDTMAFCKSLAKDYKVGLAPGEAFRAGRRRQTYASVSPLVQSG